MSVNSWGYVIIETKILDSREQMRYRICPSLENVLTQSG